MNATKLRGVAALIRESRDDELDDALNELEDTLGEIVKRLDSIEHALGAVARGVMMLQKEEMK